MSEIDKKVLKEDNRKEDKNIEASIANRLSADAVERICGAIRRGECDASYLYTQMMAGDDKRAWNAAWVLSHCRDAELAWLESKRSEIAEETMRSANRGKVRLMLSLIYRLPFGAEFNVAFYDYCLERMSDGDTEAGVRSLCLKIVSKMSATVPELRDELHRYLALLDDDRLSPAVRCAKRAVERML